MIIYKITNLVNNKVYIGQTTKDLEYRIKMHLKESKTNKTERPFLNALRKYGIENFKKEIIDTASSLEELDEKEIKWINFYDSTNREKGYNIFHGGQFKKMATPEFGKRVSEGLKKSEKWQEYIKTDEYRNRIKEYCTKKGEKLKEEHKQKIWDKNKDRILSLNKERSKSWIIIDENNTIKRLKSKDEFFNNLNIDTSVFTRMSQNISKNMVVKRFHGYYCLYDINQTDEDILNFINQNENALDKANVKYEIYNDRTGEVKTLRKNDVKNFCKLNNLDYSIFLRVLKGKFKYHKGWTII